jgi:hypothetical protein
MYLSLPRFQHDWQTDCLEDSLSQLASNTLDFARTRGQQYDKFVAAQTHQQITLPHLGLQPLG